MNGVNPYLELLKKELLRKCISIDTSINELRKLKLGDFKKMSKIIQDTLDNGDLLSEEEKKERINFTVSVSTLRRLFKYGYSIQPMEERVLNTLNKFCWFLGHESWEIFVSSKNKQLQIKRTNIETILASVVTNANKAEFGAYKLLPHIKTATLLKYLEETGTAYKRIYNILVRHKKRGWVINNDDNPSGYQMNKLWIERFSEKEAIIKTEEYWYLRWFEVATGKYRNIYNEQNTQTWTLIFKSGTWKVVSTYYPPRKKKGGIKSF